MTKFATYPSLKGKTAIVTGGAGGIGEATVIALAEQGSKIGIVDIDEAAGAALAAKLGDNVHFEACDLKDIAALETAFANITATLGAPTILVNNAAHDDRHFIEDVTPDYFDDRIAVNLRHYFFAIKAVKDGMKQAGGGSIINLSSTSWMEGTDALPVYATAKAGCHGMTRAMRHSLGADNIRVNTVVPGWVMTERQKELWVSEEGLKGRLEMQSLKTLIQPDDLARMILFLASDDSAMSTGQMFMVEGGVV